MNQTIKIQALTLALVLVSGCQKNEISEQNTTQQRLSMQRWLLNGSQQPVHKKNNFQLKMLKKLSKSTSKNQRMLLVIMAKKLPLMRLL